MRNVRLRTTKALAKTLSGYDAETCTSDVQKKSKNHRKQNLEDEANKIQLDKEDTQRSNLNSKYQGVTLVIKYPDPFIWFYCVQ